MGTIWAAVGRFFGPSHNDRYAELLRRLCDIAVETAAHFTHTSGRDLDGIVALERRADRVVEEIHELLDNSFILRFDMQDAMELADEVDNMIDGMRKVATHLDIYKTQLGELRPDVHELIAIGERMVGLVRDLVSMLSEPRLNLGRVRDLSNRISDAEGAADKLVTQAERRLVLEYGAPSANRLEFIAWTKLYELLETVTDDAKHCGKLVLSLARKES